MNLLDIALLLLALGYAASGYVRGFVVGASSTVGLLAGGVVGAIVIPRLLDNPRGSAAMSLSALVGVLLIALLGQVVGAAIGSVLRRQLTWSPVRLVDSLAGAGLSALAALVIAWALGYALSGVRVPWLGNEVRNSSVLGAVNAAMPRAATELLSGLDDLVSSSFFPRLFDPFSREPIVPVGPPDSGVLDDPDIARAADSVVKVVGEAEQCSRGLGGSGFVYAPQRVMTNAHVVAGVSQVEVEVDGRRMGAEVVVFDPTLDVAVLAVDGLERPALTFDPSGAPGDRAAVLGFPEDGPFSAVAARIRAEQRLVGDDIYGDESGVRQVLSVRSRVLPGNSGGPLVSSAGEVYGVIFAASVSDADTGYALTAEQVAQHADSGVAAQAPVSTGACS
jgi:S1-C subfamily serine protease